MPKKPKPKYQEPKETARNYAPISSRWAWIAVAGVALVTTIIRLHILKMPLERDEGEYAYMGQLMLHGIPPYVMAYNMKFPGIYAAYALIMAVFGQSIAGIHLGLIVANVATIFLIFMLVSRLFDRGSGIAAAGAYAFLSVGRAFLGMTANSEHFVVLPAVAGLVLLLDAIERDKIWRLVWSGLLLGLAMMVKQHGVMFAAFGVCYLVWCELRRRPIKWASAAGKTLLMMVAIAVPFLLTCAIMWKVGAFSNFWFWTFDYARKYAAEVTWEVGKPFLTHEITEVWAVAGTLVLLAGAGLIAPLWDQLARRRAIFTTGFLVFSCVAVSIGLEFRGHYFILLLPAMAVLVGSGVNSLARLLVRSTNIRMVGVLPALLLAGGCIYNVYAQSDIFFPPDPAQLCRTIYVSNPFPESIIVADYIRQHSNSDDRIAVIGSEPQIYFYANRKSATGYIYTYAMVENQDYALGMQREMIAEITKAKPKFIVFVSCGASWIVHPGAPEEIFTWSDNYLARYYRKVGLVNVMDPPVKEGAWGTDSIVATPGQSGFLSVYERNGG